MGAQHVRQRWYQTITMTLTLAMLVMLSNFALPQAVSANSAGTNDSSKLLQFTSAGHVLGFTDNSVIVASASHMLKINFLNSRAVTPEADNSVSGESNTGAAPALGRVTYHSSSLIGLTANSHLLFQISFTAAVNPQPPVFIPLSRQRPIPASPSVSRLLIPLLGGRSFTTARNSSSSSRTTRQPILL